MSSKLNKKSICKPDSKVISSKFKREVKEFVKAHEDVLKKLAER